MSAESWITLGRILGPHGVRGWVRVYSDTRPAEGLLAYPQWWLGEERQAFRVTSNRRSGKSLLALLAEGYEQDDRPPLASRDEALALRGLEIAVPRSALPALAEDENYQADLIGLSVINLEGESLGKVESFMASSAHDVLVTRSDAADGDAGSWLIPFVRDEIVHEVDIDQGLIRVDWSREWVSE